MKKGSGSSTSEIFLNFTLFSSISFFFYSSSSFSFFCCNIFYFTTKGTNLANSFEGSVLKGDSWDSRSIKTGFRSTMFGRIFFSDFGGLSFGFWNFSQTFYSSCFLLSNFFLPINKGSFC